MNYTSTSVWAQCIAPSPTLAVDAKAKALKASGHDVCLFGVGEPDFDTPDFIKNACIQALKDGKTKYVATAGIPELREAIAHKYTHHNQLCGGITSNQVLVSPGGKMSCYLAIMATCSPGDEVIIPAPYWVSYPEMVKLAGAMPHYIFAGKENHFKITPEQLQQAITPKTRLLIINSPSNPTGSIYTLPELEALAKVALKNGIYILSDEIYEHLVYDKHTHHSIASISQEYAAITMTASGFSKTYSMTGWRLGTLVGPQHLIKAAENLQSHMCSNATAFAQYGALEALRNKTEFDKFLSHMLQIFNKRRLLLWKGLCSIQGIECLLAEGAFYLFPKISQLGLDSMTFAQKLLDESNVAVVPGIAFGADQYVRFSYATSETVIEKGIERLRELCSRL